MTEKPYLEKVVIEKVWNPKYDQLARCVCGHDYERHFDSYDGMSNIGCKYCACTEFIPTNPTNRWYCRRCEDLTEHAHQHDTAHDVVGTHMVGSERYTCKDCSLVTHRRDEGFNHFSWWLDK